VKKGRGASTHLRSYTRSDGRRHITFNVRKLSFWFAQYGLTPLIPPAPFSPRKAGREGGAGEGGDGGRRSRPPSPPLFDSPSPLGRKIFHPNGEGAGGEAMRLPKCKTEAEKLAPKLKYTPFYRACAKSLDRLSGDSSRSNKHCQVALRRLEQPTQVGFGCCGGFNRSCLTLHTPCPFLHLC